MTHNAAQPIPDTEGEWRFLDNGYGLLMILMGDEVIAQFESKDPRYFSDRGPGETLKIRQMQFAQIVSDHNAARSQALLVEAAGAALSLLRNIGTGKWANTPAGDKLRAALKAAGVEEK
jgi:hypothetical protein